jgi:hypothetical protein
MDSSGSRDQGSEPLGSVNGGKFLDQLTDWKGRFYM